MPATMRHDDQFLAAMWPDAPATSGINRHAATLQQLQQRLPKAWREAHLHHQRRMEDVTITEPARLVKSAAYARGMREKMQTTYQEARTGLQDEVSRLQGVMRRHLNPPSDMGEAILFGEVREYLRTLSPGKRLALVDAECQKPLNEADMRIVHAALAGPAALQLLPAETVERYSNLYLSAKDPNGWSQMTQYRDVLQHVDAGWQRFEAQLSDMVDQRAAAAYEQAAA